ncbi:MAG: hypothetical protein JO303_10585 [Caulobacteraceae bacterium]|nr:hypothetical protein [Caulobacteraceae bacterium]
MSALALACAPHAAKAQNGAEAAGSAPSPAPATAAVKDPIEAAAFDAAMAQADPAAQGAALEAFVARYPNSLIRADALEKATAAYLEARDLDKVEALSGRLLTLEPRNARALAMLAFVLRQRAAAAPADQAPALADKAAAVAERGLANLAGWRPAADAGGDAAASARSEMSAIFNGALGYRALLQKDYATARPYYLAAVAADPTGLDDVYQLAVVSLQGRPSDPVGFWWAARAEALAAAAEDAHAKAAIEAYARPLYRRYHGTDDDWEGVLAQAQGAMAPPAGFAIAPAPSPASVAVQAVHDSPVASLSFSDWEFILAQRDASPQNRAAADKVWDNIAALQSRGLKMRFKVKVIAVRPHALDAAVTDNNQGAGHADLHVSLAVDPTSALKPGATTEVTGVLTGYTPSPFAFTMQQAQVEGDGGAN